MTDLIHKPFQPDIEARLSKLEQRIELVTEQNDIMLREVARLKRDLPEIIKQVMKAVLNGRAIQGMP